jgi:hypothetical protein
MQDDSQAMGAYRLMGAFAPKKTCVEVAVPYFLDTKRKKKNVGCQYFG